MLTMVHTNPASLDDKVFRVDRKFHVGMQMYAQKIGARVATINPEISAGAAIMDLIEVPRAELTYDVLTVKVDRAWRPLPSEIPRLRDQISRSRLLYDGDRLGTPRIARACGVPYILMLEYDLATQITVATTQVGGGIRPAVRTLRCAWRYATTEIPDMRGALSVHCNGYPIFDAAKQHNPNILLYLDSRMSKDMVISREAVQRRLAARSGRPLRLLYSGRYEKLKGADDAIRVAAELLERGIDLEMHCYGQGRLRAEMEKLAAAARGTGKIHIHDAIPYPELVSISRSFDLFVCCHVQGDPSCTYLESFGSGLPIVGYANRMWRRLMQVSGAGFAGPLGRPEKLADEVQRLATDGDALAQMSFKAQAFALEHSFEQEFGKRVEALNAAMA